MTIRYRATAFTLVELLVVIGIIALLISVLLPALNKARQSAQSAQCASNIRQVGTMMSLYVQDYKGSLPPGRWGTPTYINGNGLRWYIFTAIQYFPTQFKPQMSNPATDDPRFALRITKRKVYANVFTCPSDGAAQDHRFNGSPDIEQFGQGMSYFGNGNIFLIHETMKMSKIRRSSEMILMSEKGGQSSVGDGFGGNTSYPNMGGGRHPRVSAGALVGSTIVGNYGRHGGGRKGNAERYHNTLYADFHVEATPYVRIWSGNSADYLAGGQYRRYWFLD